MDILEIGTDLIKKQFGIDIDSSVISEALSGLLSDKGSQIDIPELVSKLMASGGLENIVQSWLGDGQNSGISADQIAGFFGSGKISEFASQLGLGEGQATKGLAKVIPQLLDKASSGGSLLDGLDDIGGMLNMAKKFF